VARDDDNKEEVGEIGEKGDSVVVEVGEHGGENDLDARRNSISATAFARHSGCPPKYVISHDAIKPSRSFQVKYLGKGVEC